jgi:hypothetical protein
MMNEEIPKTVATSILKMLLKDENFGGMKRLLDDRVVVDKQLWEIRRNE